MKKRTEEKKNEKGKQIFFKLFFTPFGSSFVRLPRPFCPSEISINDADVTVGR